MAKLSDENALQYITEILINTCFSRYVSISNWLGTGCMFRKEEKCELQIELYRIRFFGHALAVPFVIKAIIVLSLSKLF